MNKEVNLSNKGYFTRQVLAKSHQKEANRISFYRSLKLAFLPFNVGISRLMKELEAESNARMERLEETATSFRILEKLTSYIPETIREKPQGRQHFFVIDARMALDVLEHAWQHEYKAQCFYEWLKAGNNTPGLDKLLTDFIKQAKNQGRILQDAKAEVSLLGQWRRDTGMFKRIV